MASQINASNSGFGGIVSTGDSSGVLQLQTTGTTAVTIDTSQNVGIGTSAPNTFPGKLAVIGDGIVTDYDMISRVSSVLSNADRGFKQITDGSGEFSIYSPNGGGCVFGIGSSYTERMRIDSGGGVLIGTTTNTPGYKLYVKGGDGNQLILDNAGSTYTTMNYYNNGANKLTLFWDNTTPRYYVVPAAGGGVYLAAGGTSWTSTSDERVKDIIEPITDAANKVSTLRAVIGKYKTDEEGTRRAFLIAQDVHQVFPEAVDTANENEYGLRYQDTIPLLVAAIQEQQTIINDLKARIETLEAK